MAQKNHQNCCNTQPRHAHRNENKSEILLNVTMEGAKARGLAYWQLLSDIINQEPVHERDRIIMATLKPLGIEKGKLFQPDARQKKILEDAAFVGEAMAKANSFDKRFAGSRYRPETHWDYVIAVDWIAETEFYRQLDELSAYTYEATGTSKGMVTKTPGVSRNVQRYGRPCIRRGKHLPLACPAQRAGEEFLVGDALRSGYAHLH